MTREFTSAFVLILLLCLRCNREYRAETNDCNLKSVLDLQTEDKNSSRRSGDSGKLVSTGKKTHTLTVRSVPLTSKVLTVNTLGLNLECVHFAMHIDSRMQTISQ
jgi:hypothetical protein